MAIFQIDGTSLYGKIKGSTFDPETAYLKLEALSPESDSAEHVKFAVLEAKATSVRDLPLVQVDSIEEGGIRLVLPIGVSASEAAAPITDAIAGSRRSQPWDKLVRKAIDATDDQAVIGALQAVLDAQAQKLMLLRLQERKEALAAAQAALDAEIAAIG